MRKPWIVWIGAALLLGDIQALASTAASEGGPATMRRLTQAQYRNIIRDIFGEVTLGGRFEPDPRVEQLVAVGASQATVTASGLEEFERMAMGIAAQVVDPRARDQVIPCKPASVQAADDNCAREFLGRVGHLLFRRPLTGQEMAGTLKVANVGATTVKDFYYGIQLAVARLLESPQFLFVRERVEPDPVRAGGLRLAPHSMATRLSLLLWNSSPDVPLLDAAESGELASASGLARQVERMLASPRIEQGVRAFFSDMLSFDEFESLAKDGQLFPSYSVDVARQAQEQTLRTIINHLLVESGDYRDLFTTNKTFMTPILASVYRMQFPGDYGRPWEWVPYQLPKEVPQAGILTQISFLALHSHPGSTSPTLRGKALRELLLCQKVPDPPANVDFSQFESSAGEAQTVRQRLLAHNENPVCAGCHKITDPIGLALENYDAVGSFRRTERNLPIDVSGTFNGVDFTDAVGLGKALRDYPETASCAVQRVFAYGVGRQPSESESSWLNDHLNKQFAVHGYQWIPLLKEIVLSPGFYRAVAQPATPNNPGG